MASFLWHDYETFGSDPSSDFPCQFAAIRTDEALNPIGKPINLVCQIPNDYLPHPEACLITGITPQFSLAQGMLETAFADKIAAAMQEPHTCSLGYNSMRFDDEVTRFLFYRNFIDPYAREWQQGNSRWDLIDLVRACYALRPEGIEWPLKEDGTPSFRLEALSEANQLNTGKAHDALVDVRATLGLARLIKQKHPRLFNYAFSLRDKNHVKQMFDWSRPTALLHVSALYPASQGCCSLIMPVAMHPHNANAIIVVDLLKDPTPLLSLSWEALRERVFAPKQALDAAVTRPGVGLIYLNRSPFLAPAKTLDEATAERLGIDILRCREHFKQLSSVNQWRKEVIDIYTHIEEKPSVDVERGLYSGGFMSDQEKIFCQRIRHASPQQLMSLAESAPSERLAQLFFLYRGRNFPNTFTDLELQRWQRHRQQVFQENGVPGRLTLNDYLTALNKCLDQHAHDRQKVLVLRQLSAYVEML